MLSLRPTAVQAVGRGVYHGAAAGAAGSLIVFLTVVVVAREPGLVALVAVLAPLLVGGWVGAALGLWFGRYEGADIDDRGIRFVPDTLPAFAAWPEIEDLRVERYGGRLHVAVYHDDGWSIRLRAPYDGRLLAADPEFERKLFMLRHLWETHRHARHRDRRRW